MAHEAEISLLVGAIQALQNELAILESQPASRAETDPPLYCYMDGVIVIVSKVPENEPVIDEVIRIRDHINNALEDHFQAQKPQPRNPHIPPDGIIVGRRVEQGWPDISWIP